MKKHLNINHNTPIRPETLYKMFQGDRITTHQENAKVLMILSCIFGAMATFGAGATALSALQKHGDGAEFILGITSGMLFIAGINTAILYKTEKDKIAQLQKHAHQHLR